MINISDKIYVLGSLLEENREVVHVPDGETEDLPEAAVFAYSSAFTQFPYNDQ